MFKFKSIFSTLVLIFSCLIGVFGQSATDLTLKSRFENQKVELGAQGTVTLTVKNQSQTNATKVKVLVKTPNASPFVRFVTSVSTSGEFSISSGLWEIPAIAGQDSAVLQITYSPNEYGIWFLESEIYSLDQTDVDSSPLNQSVVEDDFTKSCISIPIKVSASNFAGRQIIINDAGTNNFVWRKDGVIVQNQTSNILHVNSVGSYTFESPNVNCPTQGCCPYIFEIGPQTLCCEPLEYIYEN